MVEQRAWRREWDSNPRDGAKPPTRSPVGNRIHRAEAAVYSGDCPGFHLDHTGGVWLKEEAMQTLTLENVRTDYLLCQQIEGKAPGTINMSELVTRLFMEHLDGDEISPQRIRSFLFWLAEERNPTTVNMYCRSLRAFARWTVREGYLEEDPMKDIRTPKAPQKFPRVLTDEEVKALIEASKSDPRRHAITLLLVDTGIRASECAGLKIDDTQLWSRTAKVFGKGGKERTVFYCPITARSLARYLAVRPDIPFQDTLFLNRRMEPITRYSLNDILHRLSVKAGLSKPVSPMTMRHTFATSYVRGGGEAHTLQYLLGHSTIAMSMRYVDLVGRDLAEAHSRYSPVMRLLGKGGASR
jgi:site-specific recombinase XerD